MCAHMCGSDEMGREGGIGYCWLKEKAMIHVGWGKGKVRVSVSVVNILHTF